ncbi:hypothetical protein [Actinoallomurus soli]|uniref:hypothetical protein n=1 Tax=Actinoallomurus soli TaxID=2952535 RepID=UPI0020935310|nr:hypothetical protein [Actinoallomurus soli]MCO5971850.1 hypothetical protein [Actinoallomurus soli]
MAAGRPSPLNADLSERLLPVAEAIAEPLRGFACAPALDPRPADDATAALLRYLGRAPGVDPLSRPAAAVLRDPGRALEWTR